MAIDRLRLLGGLTTDEIARSFLVAEATMALRLVRAKRKIAPAGLPLPGARRGGTARPPPSGALRRLPRLQRGYAATSGGDLLRADLSAEAIRLASMLVRLMPDEPEVHGLLALLLLIEARRAARTDGGGSLVLLADQDRSRWDAEMIAQGHAMVTSLIHRNQPGPYQLQAAINAVHTDAASAVDTDWEQILQLYDQLVALSPTPIVALN
jgi:RNA polymerase sigma-70 factor (ECF subfamily)